jgi:hypothetical protein
MFFGASAFAQDVTGWSTPALPLAGLYTSNPVNP